MVLAGSPSSVLQGKGNRKPGWTQSPGRRPFDNSTLLNVGQSVGSLQRSCLQKSALVSGLKLTEPCRNTPAAFSRLTTGLKESPRGLSVLQEHPYSVHEASFQAASGLIPSDLSSTHHSSFPVPWNRCSLSNSI